MSVLKEIPDFAQKFDLQDLAEVIDGQIGEKGAGFRHFLRHSILHKNGVPTDRVPNPNPLTKKDDTGD